MNTEPKVIGPHDSILFRKLNDRDAQDFRDHARLNHVPGEAIRFIYHPVWRAQAELIDEQAGVLSTYSD